MIAVLWAYEGWQFGTYSAGEVIDPQKSFPRAFFLGSLILVALYLIANVAYLIALGATAATASDAIAATAASSVLGPWAGKFIALTILISVFSSTNSVILTAPRVFYAMANDNLFFKKLAEVHKRFGTPAAAVIALGVWSAILACTGKFAELIGGVIFVGWIFYGLGAAAIFPLRRRNQEKPIPYRVPGYPFTPFIFVLAAAAIVANAIVLAFYDPASFQHILAAIVIFLLGLPACFFWRHSETFHSVSVSNDHKSVRTRGLHMLEVNVLSKFYGSVPAVREVTFRLEPGQVLGYLGPNGSGKSTTVKMLTGLLEPTRGEVLYKLENINKDLSAYRRHLGYVPEEANLYPYLTGEE
jgi:amino acid transporter